MLAKRLDLLLLWKIELQTTMSVAQCKQFRSVQGLLESELSVQGTVSLGDLSATGKLSRIVIGQATMHVSNFPTNKLFCLHFAKSRQ
jgi:hypothetical protein